MKLQRLPRLVRIFFGIVAIFTALGAVSIAIDAESSDDLPFIIAAVLFTAAFGYGAIAGQFPDIENQRKRERNNVT
jgi:4-hydroxybenzoate polyprenyltransferase